jgi:hypothetical protein
MKLFNEILGLIILSGPLWLILIIILLGAWITHKAGKRFKSSNSKFMIFAGVFALIFLLLFGDGIAGKIYLKHLCDTKSGINIYQKYKLPDKDWGNNGKPKIHKFKSNMPGIINLVGIDKPIFEEIPFTESYDTFFNIKRFGFRLRKINTKKVFAEIVYYRYWGGWLSRNFSLNHSAVSCNQKDFDDWEEKVFELSSNQN